MKNAQLSESELPDSWVQIELGDVIDYGRTTKVEPVSISPDTWVLELEDIEKDTSRLVQRLTFSDRQSKSTKNAFMAGDVLYGKLRPYLNKIVFAEAGGVCTTEIVPIRGNVAVYGRYLFHWMRHPTFVNYVNEVSHGVNMPRLGTDAGRKAPFVLAPMPEQKRIADKLDTVLARVDACRQRLGHAAVLIARFRQSVLAAATSGELTKDWRSLIGLGRKWADVRLCQIADVQGGVTKDSKKQSLTDEEVPYLRVANVQRGHIDLTEIKCIRIPGGKLNNLLLEAGDILFNEGGDIDKVGRGWVWESQIPRCSFQNHIFRARLHDKRNQPKYISWWSNFRGLEYFLRAGKQTTNLASINKTVLSDLPISLPPHEEQAEIVRRVEVLFAFADRIEARLAQAQSTTNRLAPSLLAKAFRGELVPQDPNDEPASELLKRLAEGRSAIGVVAKNSRGRKATRAVEDAEESSAA